MADNANLGAAKSAKNDEFYTQYSDIEAEMNAYVEYNPDVFRGKTILLPCDDPEWSNFTKYFASNFERFGLKKLISTSYAKSAGSRQLTFFEKTSPRYDAEKHETRGKLFTLTHDTDGSGVIDTDDIEFNGYLEGDGDFRSKEVSRLRDEADFIITNPPFSLFREFLAWILKAEKKFVIIGSKNAITYKEVFPLLRDNKMWIGPGFANGNAFFRITPEDARSFASGVYDDGTGLVKFRNVGWYTNVDHGARHEELLLDTMAHNLKYNKKLKKKFEEEYGVAEYPRYDNYDAIEVPFTECIPSDYVPCWFNCDKAESCRWAKEKGMNRSAAALCDQKQSGAMGVPITFLDKYNPEQFEIVKFRKGDDEKDLTYTRTERNGTERNGTERNGTERNGTERNGVTQNHYSVLPDSRQEKEITESWASRSPSLISSIQNNLKSSAPPKAKERDSQTDSGTSQAGTRSPSSMANGSTRESLSDVRNNGVMGVPITFMDKYNPEQFEILGLFNHGSDGDWDLAKAVVKGNQLFKRIAIRKRRR